MINQGTEHKSCLCFHCDRLSDKIDKQIPLILVGPYQISESKGQFWQDDIIAKHSNMFTPEHFLANSTTTNLVNYSTTTVGSDHDTDDETANVITTTIGGGLSMIGVVFIVFSYFKLLEYRAGGTTAQTILLFISTGIMLLYLHGDLFHSNQSL